MNQDSAQRTVNATDSIDADAGLSRMGGSTGLYHAALAQFVALLELQLGGLPAQAAASPQQLQRLHGLAGTVAAGRRQHQLSARQGAARERLGELLPAMREAHAAARAWQVRHAGMATVLAPGAPQDDGPARVLVIDDQPAVIHGIRAVLKEQHQVFMATSGADGLRSFRQQQPDLVLLDVDMPGMSGLQVAQELRQLTGGANTPLIVVTGHGGTHAESACWEAGAVDFINKPINPQTLRNRVRAHLTLKRQADLLRRQAYIEGLTGLANRRSLDERLVGELRRAQRDGSSLVLLLADIDFFKRYNDHYGHPAGDECLRPVARAFHSCLERPADLAARIGGEEFAVLLAGTELAGAHRVAQRLCAAVAALGLAHAVSEVAPHVTVGLGGVCQPAGVPAGASLLQLADQELYKAKHTGRARYSMQQLAAVAAEVRA